MTRYSAGPTATQQILEIFTATEPVLANVTPGVEYKAIGSVLAFTIRWVAVAEGRDPREVLDGIARKFGLTTTD